MGVLDEVGGYIILDGRGGGMSYQVGISVENELWGARGSHVAGGRIADFYLGDTVQTTRGR